MANYLIALKTDSSGKKFLQVLSSNGGANEFMAIQGGTPVTQHGELVAPMEVSSESLAALLTALGEQLTDLGDQLPAALVGGKLPVQSSQLPAALVDGKLPVTALVPGNTDGEYSSMGVNGTFGSGPHAFLLSLWIITSGIVTIKDATTTQTVVNGAPVTAGQFIQPAEFYVDGGLNIVFSSGASGTIFYRTV